MKITNWIKTYETTDERNKNFSNVKINNTYLTTINICAVITTRAWPENRIIAFHTDRYIGQTVTMTNAIKY